MQVVGNRSLKWEQESKMERVKRGVAQDGTSGVDVQDRVGL